MTLPTEADIRRIVREELAEAKKREADEAVRQVRLMKRWDGLPDLKPPSGADAPPEQGPSDAS